MILGGLAVVVLTTAVVLARRGPRAIPIDVDTVTRRQAFRSYVTASGEIVATRFADIGSSAMGRVVALNVAEGDRVKAGQVLARIDPVQARSETDAAQAQVQALQSEAQAARQQVQAAASDLAQASARAREARQNFDRVKGLHDQGLVTSANLDSARAATEAAEAQVTAASANIERAKEVQTAADRRISQARAGVVRARDILQKTEIAAPIDGVVSRLRVRLGEMVVIGIQNQPGTILMTVSDLSSVNAEVKVAEADILRVAIGQPARVTLEAIPGRVFVGRVIEVGASALPLVGTGAAAREFRVVVRLDQPDPGLRPGLTCDAEVLTSERQNVLTVPLQAVVLRPGPDGTDRSGVFVAREGRAEFVPVTTGIIGGLDIEVAGLDAGRQIIVGPFQVLRDLQAGTAVSVTTPSSR
jgi:HlyD family secretion protein